MLVEIVLIRHMVAGRTSPIESSITINGVRANNKCLIHAWPYYIDCPLLSLKMVKRVLNGFLAIFVSGT